MLSIVAKTTSLRRNHKILLPLGVEKSQFLIKKHDDYELIVDDITSTFKEVFGDDNLLCFYCGTPSNNIIPHFLHDGSGRNLWLLNDPNSCSVVCNECRKSYGLKNIRYSGHFQDFDIRSGSKINRLLSFEPEVLLPGLESTYFHFKHNEDGQLEPLSQRAERTIEAFNLNRSELVHRRLSSIQTFVYSGNPSIYDDLGSPFDILFIFDYLKKINKNNNFNIVSKSELNNLVGKYNIDANYLIDVETKFIPYKSISFQNIYHKNESKYSEKFPGIDVFSFSGIRSFNENKVINFSGKNSIIILGENGVGKSTFLELFKRAFKSKSKRTLEDICNKNIDNQIPEYVIKYSGADNECHYKERSGRPVRREKCNLVNITENRSNNNSVNSFISWVNSYRTDQMIIDWIATKLSVLLSLPNDYVFCTVEGDVYWRDRKNNKKIYIHELSSGYNSIITIFSKMITSVSKIGENVTLKEINLRLSSSIVLIDEIELHLHPKFKKSIIHNMQSAFAEVLFIITTHDPLVLKSINDGTIVLCFKKDRDETQILSDLPAPQGLTTEQILTSPHFGLDTIDSNDLQPIIDAYNNAIHNEEWVEVERLRISLFKLGYFGKTYRELIALSAVDSYFRNGENPSLNQIVQELRNSDLNND
ncbi:AAA family ATPase [Vibrio vulnificus]|nr:AAA family ATPase [Vibrio vulnificus]HCM0827631.1 AAA family ATPase [Vibrio parahaemolyticus]